VFAIIWFGISNATTIFVVFMTAMPLILTNVWQGALTVDRDYVELARSFRMSHAQIMRKIFLPTIPPHLFAGACVVETKPVAFVVLKPGRSLSADSVKELALAHAPAYQHPRRVWFVEAFALASTNKIDRAMLKRDAVKRLAAESDPGDA
jgi:acyl-CoA synthetase (AMP-forming)/AMP-acid ligase II